MTLTARSGYGSPNDGNTTLINQPEGISTQMTYDIWGNILTATQGDNQHSSTQRWSYNELLQLCRHYTPETNSTLYEYDARHQVAKFSQGHSGSTGCGNITAGVTNTYDPRQRLTHINYSDATPDVSLQYDANGNLTRNQRGTTHWTYTYDNLDQLTNEALNVDGRTYGLSYQYNSMSSLIRRTLPSGRTIDYDHNGLARVTKVSSNGTNYASGINYHVNGLINGMTYGNGLQFSQDINNRQLPTRLRAGAALDLQYSYDARSDVTNITDWRNRSRDRHMDYDGLGRLTTANGVWGNGNYSYDALGNLERKQLGNRVVNISYDRNRNRATRSTDTTGTTRNLNYDNRGNVTRLGTQYFTYDQANQPSTLTGSANGNYTYDGNFKRVKAEIDGKTIYNVYDASGSLVHIDSLSGTRTLTVCTETCKNISIASSGATDYIRANGMTIARLTNDQPTYLHPDLLGSPVAATDQRGNISWQEHYTPYGEKWGTTNAANDDQMGFTGHISDSATGLTYMQARYYDPVGGRFLSSDPVGFTEHLSGTQGVQGLNRYAYVNNSPYRYTDPDGREVVVHSRPVKGTFGAGAHTFTTVTTSEGATVISSSRVNGENVVSLNNPSDAGSDVNITDSVTIDPPDGMTESEFDQSVLDQAESMMEADPTAYEVFPSNATEGNCHVTTTNLINGAGGSIPDDFDPKGLNPGLNEELE